MILRDPVSIVLFVFRVPVNHTLKFKLASPRLGTVPDIDCSLVSLQIISFKREHLSNRKISKVEVTS